MSTKADIYSDLYKQGQQVLKDNDPCKWKDGNCAAGTHGCCQGCKHLGPKGCTVEALACKLWLCHEIKRTPDGARAEGQLYILRLIGFEQRVPALLRSSKEESFKAYRNG